MKWIRRAAWVLVVLLLLSVLIWTGANLYGSSKYQTAIRTLEAEGFELQPAKIAPPPVPALENGAPFYAAAFALYVEPERDEQAGPWAKLRDLEPADRAVVETWLARNGEAFEMIRRAQKRPRCRFERDYRQGYSLPLPELSKVIALSRALAMLAEQQVLAGDGAAARETVKLMFGLGESLRDDAILVSVLVRLTAANLALGAVDNVVSDQTSAAELAEWQAVLPKDEFLQGGMERAYRAEMALAAAVIGDPSPEIWEMLAGQGALNRILWDLARPLVRSDGARFLLDMRRMVRACGMPYREALAEIDQVPTQEIDPIWSPVRRMLMPAMGKCLNRQAAVQAKLRLVRAGLEMERVRRTAGSYPEATSAIDPFSGKPLVVDLKAGTVALAGPPDKSLPEDEPLIWKLRPPKK